MKPASPSQYRIRGLMTRRVAELVPLYTYANTQSAEVRKLGAGEHILAPSPEPEPCGVSPPNLSKTAENFVIFTYASRPRELIATNLIMNRVEEKAMILEEAEVEVVDRSSHPSNANLRPRLTFSKARVARLNIVSLRLPHYDRVSKRPELILRSMQPSFQAKLPGPGAKHQPKSP